MMWKAVLLFAFCAVALAEEKKEARSAAYPQEEIEDPSVPVKFPGPSYSNYSPDDKGSLPTSGVDASYPEEGDKPSYVVQTTKRVPFVQRNERPTLLYPEDNNGDYDQQQIQDPYVNLLFPNPNIAKRPFPQYPSENTDDVYITQQGKLPGPTIDNRPFPIPSQGPQRPQYPEEVDGSFVPDQILVPGHIGVVPRPPHHLRPQVQPPMPLPQPGYGFGGRPNPGQGFITRPQPGQGFITTQPGEGFITRPQGGQVVITRPQPGQSYGGNPQPGHGNGGNLRPGQGFGGNPHHGHGFGGNPRPGHGYENNFHSLEDVIPGTPGKDYPTYSIVPTTSFHCQTEYPGFYADMEAGCQVWHYCQLDGRQDSFLCPNGTLFNQKYFVCDWWYNVDCPASRNYYPLNANLYKEEPKPHRLPQYPGPTHSHHNHGSGYPQPGLVYPLPAPRPSHHIPTFKGVPDVHEVPEDELGYRAVKKSNN